MNYKILIIGKTSGVAKHIYDKFIHDKRLKIITVSTKTDFNYVKQFKKLERLINNFRPNFVFNLAALTTHEKCKKNPKVAYEVNSLFPHKLALLCKKNKSFLIHFSSDVIFDGEKNKLYEVDDMPIPKTLQGQSIFYGENLVLSSSNSLIFRLPMLFGKFLDKKFIYKCLKTINKNNYIYLCSDIYCSPINASDVANFLLSNIFNKKKFKTLLKKRLIHLSTDKRISRYQFIKNISYLIKKSKYVKKIKYDNLKLKIMPQRSLGIKSNVKNFISSDLKNYIDEINL